MFHGATNLVIQDSVFKNFNLTDVHAPVSLKNSTVLVHNTTFSSNTAPLSGGIAAATMENITLDNCTFMGNYGECPCTFADAGLLYASI